MKSLQYDSFRYNNVREVTGIFSKKIYTTSSPESASLERAPEVFN